MRVAGEIIGTSLLTPLHIYSTQRIPQATGLVIDSHQISALTQDENESIATVNWQTVHFQCVLEKNTAHEHYLLHNGITDHLIFKQ